MKEMAARAAVAEVQAHHAVWSLSELRFEVGRALPPGASAELVRQVADLAVTPGAGTGVLLVTAPEVTDVTPLGTRKDGTSIYRPPNEARYTTAGQVDLEERILGQARRAVPPRVSEGMARRALSGLGSERRAGRRGGAAADHHHRGVRPDRPGRGWEDAHRRRVRQAWTRLTGRRVIGITTAQNAARQMAAEGLAEVYNSAAFLGKTKGSDLLRYPVTIGAGDVLVLDESSMISTADLALIMDYADRAGALVVPTGDAGAARPGRGGRHVPRPDRRAGRGRADRGPPVRPRSGSGAPRSGCAPGTSPSSPPTTGGAGSAAATGRPPMTVRRAHGWPTTCTGGTRSCWPGRTRKQPSLHGACRPSSSRWAPWCTPVHRSRTGTAPAPGT